jgi:glycosyltransferase involved in cell wall biosynthesis
MHGYVGLSPRLALYYKLDRWALRRMDHVVVVSPDLDDVARRAGVSAHRIAQIDNAIDTSCYRRSQSVASAKKLHELDERRICIGAVGRLEAEKGFENLITAVRDLTAQGAELQCLLIGEGSLRPRLQETIDAFGLQGIVKLLGHRRDVLDLYQAMDIFVLSSLREGLPNVVLEALACEVPVVATRIAGVPQLISDGENGLLVSPDNVGELRRGIQRLVEDAALRRRLAAAGRKTVEERFSFTERMRKITAVYDSLLRKNPLQYKPVATHSLHNTTRGSCETGTGTPCSP